VDDDEDGMISESEMQLQQELSHCSLAIGISAAVPTWLSPPSPTVPSSSSSLHDPYPSAETAGVDDDEDGMISESEMQLQQELSHDPVLLGSQLRSQPGCPLRHLRSHRRRRLCMIRICMLYMVGTAAEIPIASEQRSKRNWK
jgi:hypothetical protein